MHSLYYAGELNENPEWPGTIFSDTSNPREVTISREATKIEEKGLSLSIPENAISKDVPLSIATSFGDTFKVPEDIRCVSPAYLIGTTTIIEFSKDVDLVLQHTANVRTDEDCKDMVVMKASVCDSDRGKFFKFVELQGNDVTFKKNGRVGIVKLRNLVTSSYKVGRRKKDTEVKGK